MLAEMGAGSDILGRMLEEERELEAAVAEVSFLPELVGAAPSLVSAEVVVRVEEEAAGASNSGLFTF